MRERQRREERGAGAATVEGGGEGGGDVVEERVERSIRKLREREREYDPRGESGAPASTQDIHEKREARSIRKRGGGGGDCRISS